MSVLLKYYRKSLLVRRICNQQDDDDNCCDKYETVASEATGICGVFPCFYHLSFRYSHVSSCFAYLICRGSQLLALAHQEIFRFLGHVLQDFHQFVQFYQFLTIGFQLSDITLVLKLRLLLTTRQLGLRVTGALLNFIPHRFEPVFNLLWMQVTNEVFNVAQCLRLDLLLLAVACFVSLELHQQPLELLKLLVELDNLSEHLRSMHSPVL